MFRISIETELIIKDCPESGVAAIDWRRKHGVEPAPTNKFLFVYHDDSDEDFCRAFLALLNKDADLVIPAWEIKYRSCPIPADLVPPKTGDEALVVVTLLTEWKAVNEARCKQRDEETTKRQQKEYEEREVWRAIAAKNDDLQREKEREERQKKTKHVEELYSDALAWMPEHGSERLRRMVEENIEFWTTYLDERLAVERPGWQYVCDLDAETNSYSEPRNPPLEAFALLDEARKADAEAELVYWKVANPDYASSDYYEEEDRYKWTGYAVVGVFLDEKVVYGLKAD